MSLEAAECGNLTEEYHTVWKSYEFWCEGVLFSSLGMFGQYSQSQDMLLSREDDLGLLSNTACIVTLLSADMRKQTFNQMLAILSAIDVL